VTGVPVERTVISWLPSVSAAAEMVAVRRSGSRALPAAEPSTLNERVLPLRAAPSLVVESARERREAEGRRRVAV